MLVAVDKNTFMKLDSKVLLILSAENDTIVRVLDEYALAIHKICQDGEFTDFSDPKISYILASLKKIGFLTYEDSELPVFAQDLIVPELIVAEINDYLKQDSFTPLHGQVSSTVCNCVSYSDNCASF